MCPDYSEHLTVAEVIYFPSSLILCYSIICFPSAFNVRFCWACSSHGLPPADGRSAFECRRIHEIQVFCVHLTAVVQVQRLCFISRCGLGLHLCPHAIFTFIAVEGKKSGSRCSLLQSALVAGQPTYPCVKHMLGWFFLPLTLWCWEARMIHVTWKPWGEKIKINARLAKSVYLPWAKAGRNLCAVGTIRW